MRSVFIALVLVLGSVLALRAQTLLDTLQSDPNIMEALEELDAALADPSLQGALSTLDG